MNKRKMYETIISDDIKKAAAHLRSGELVAIPTETVYGLAADATNTGAIQKVFEVKKRPAANPLIVHVADVSSIYHYVTEIPDSIIQLMEAFAPGPLTVLLPSNGSLPAAVNGGLEMMAFRIPAHPVTRKLLAVANIPLVAPSANIYTTISPTTAEHVRKNFDGCIPMILDGGPCKVGIESTVVAASGKNIVVYRQGAITMTDIATITGMTVISAKKNAVVSPGMSAHHYSPRTPLLLVDDIESIRYGDPQNIGALTFNRRVDFLPSSQQFCLSVCSDMSEAARNLYKALHHLDEMKFRLLIAERLPDHGLGKAINDRLQRAAFSKS